MVLFGTFRCTCDAVRDSTWNDEPVLVVRPRLVSKTLYFASILCVKLLVSYSKFSQHITKGRSTNSMPQNHICTKQSRNKKVLLRERKRHTARCVASARYAALSNGEGVTPASYGGGGTPTSHGGVSHSVIVVGRGYPIPSWWGEPHQVMGGIPSSHGCGGTWDGVPLHPDLWWGTPLPQTWNRSPPDLGQRTPHPDLGWGTPPHQDLGQCTPPHPDLGWGTPLPTQTLDGVFETFPSINITFPRTTCAGGKNLPWFRLYVSLSLCPVD